MQNALPDILHSPFFISHFFIWCLLHWSLPCPRAKVKCLAIA